LGRQLSPRDVWAYDEKSSWRPTGRHLLAQSWRPTGRQLVASGNRASAGIATRFGASLDVKFMDFRYAVPSAGTTTIVTACEVRRWQRKRWRRYCSTSAR